MFFSLKIIENFKFKLSLRNLGFNIIGHKQQGDGVGDIGLKTSNLRPSPCIGPSRKKTDTP